MQRKRVRWKSGRVCEKRIDMEERVGEGRRLRATERRVTRRPLVAGKQVHNVSIRSLYQTTNWGPRRKGVVEDDGRHSRLTAQSVPRGEARLRSHRSTGPPKGA